MSNPSTDSIGNQIISKHAPVFKPGDMAAAIDEAINREKVALLDELEKICKKISDEEDRYSVWDFIQAQRAKLTKEDK